MRPPPWVPVVLAGIGVVAMTALVGVDSLPLAAFWTVATLCVIWMWRSSGRPLRIVLSVALLPACVFMTFSGGLFFLPAAFALFALTLAPSRKGARANTR